MELPFFGYNREWRYGMIYKITVVYKNSTIEMEFRGGMFDSDMVRNILVEYKKIVDDIFDVSNVVSITDELSGAGDKD